jgi:hypothetical protein
MAFIIQYDAPISPVWMNENGNWTPFRDVAKVFATEADAKAFTAGRILRNGMTARVVPA